MTGVIATAVADRAAVDRVVPVGRAGADRDVDRMAVREVGYVGRVEGTIVAHRAAVVPKVRRAGKDMERRV